MEGREGDQAQFFMWIKVWHHVETEVCETEGETGEN